jgi:hypothetical protein
VLADAGARPPRRTVGRTLNLLSLFAASSPASALDGFDDTRSDYGDDDGRNFYQSFDDASSSSSSSSAALLRAPGISIVEHCAWDASAQVNALCIENKVAVVAASTGQLVALLEGHSARVTACEFGIHAPASLVTVSGAAMGSGMKTRLHICLNVICAAIATRSIEYQLPVLLIFSTLAVFIF